jgi:hypothetical protein
MNAALWTVCLPNTRSDFADDQFTRKRYSDCVFCEAAAAARRGVVKLVARSGARASNSSGPKQVAAETSHGDSERCRLRDDVPFPPALAHHGAIVGC